MLLATICSAFGCTPSQAAHELYEAPWPRVIEIMEAQRLIDAYGRVESARKAGRPMPDDPAALEVVSLQAEAGRRKRAAAGMP